MRAGIGTFVPQPVRGYVRFHRLRDKPFGRVSTQRSGTSQFAVVQALAPPLKIEVTPVNLSDPAEIERAVSFPTHPTIAFPVRSKRFPALRKKFPVMFLREFGWMSLNLLAD